MGHTPPRPPDGRKWESDETPIQSMGYCAEVIEEVGHDAQSVTQSHVQTNWDALSGLTDEAKALAMRDEALRLEADLSEMSALEAALSEADADCRELDQIREYLWPNQTGLPNEHRNCLVAIQARDKYVASRIERLEKENEVLMRAASGPAIQLAELHLRNERRLVTRIKELEEKAKKDAS